MKKIRIIIAKFFVMIVLLHTSDVYPQNIFTARTFYVDSKTGKDSNKGTESSKPWKTLLKVNSELFKPGDSILFKAGESWQGQLILKSAGSEGFPIVISRYGSGAKPLIDGKGQVEQVVLLENVDQWEIHNLEITNNSDKIGNRLGILIKSEENGLKKHFLLKDLYIHDIMGNYSFEMKGKNTGGIGIIGGAETKFDDILIENCELENINRVGIFTNITNSQNAIRGNRPITNLVIRNNKIHHCAGDGVIIRYASKPLIEYNVAYENHNASENLVKHGVALWCRSTDEATFQYNEVYNTRGKMDGQAFDADLDSYRTLIQYNYSHGNEGGFMLAYGSSSESIVRYNVSVNDGLLGKHVFDFPVWTSPRGSGIFYNNTIIIAKNIEAVIADEAIETAHFYNNIFYNQGTGELYIDSKGQTATFNNNSYYGYDQNKILAFDKKGLFNNPGLMNNSKVHNGFDKIKKFRLRKDSPLISKGNSKVGNFWLQDPLINPQDTISVIKINNQQVVKKEFQREMLRYKSQILAYFAKKYPINGTKNFWVKDFDGVKPIEAIKKRANDSLIRIKIQQQLLMKYKLWHYHSYNELLTELKKFNTFRKYSVAANQIIYGPMEFDELSFFDYQFNNAIISLKKILVQEQFINITDEKLLQHFNKMKQTVYKSKKYTFELFKTQIKDSYIEQEYNNFISDLVNGANININNSIYDIITFNN